MLKATVEDKIRLQSRTTEKYHEQIFKEVKLLEEKTSKEALPFVQKKHTLWKYQNERDVARRLQRFGNTRRMKKEADSQDLLSFDSYRSTVVDQVEEMSLESPRKMLDEQEVMRETSRNARRGRGERRVLEPEGETETLETKVVSNRVEGVYVDPNGEGHHERGATKRFQKGKRSARGRR